MLTGTIVTPSWENSDMQNISEFKPVLTEPIARDFGRVPSRKVGNPDTNDAQQVASRDLVYVWRRILVGVALICVGALFWTVLSLVVGVGEKEVGADLSSTAPREIYIVAPGDTLWSIATAIDSDGDPRDTVDRLAQLNGGSSIYVGQRLVLSS